ncbi:protein kinase HSL1 Ecym_7392 [Eremothecium cymbalariae DBVPG|uniref:non-specific serine/threonine protein kinase n=1 Tax=Eremothecium cymbalariae (strain CBS 270.75 / DBVPG 7215 / KCTC 17166 / NRRL Y-17582) TaxID=931890 RepID=G8JWK3_ERECY|nr:hypothetical protein Ecym_7392 [Eremothecium cymbalariae DBVPG\
MTVAKQTGISMGNARAGTRNTDEHIDQVVQSVSDATKRLSQISNASTTVRKTGKKKNRDTVGPWKLGKTLGKGSSGRVRLAKNMETGKLAAIKIVPKRNVRHNNTQLTSLPYGIEREIIIMKLISHPNVMALYEVWENKPELYLVLEYVEGGELFDYLISRGKLPEQEAVHYFKQIVQGVSYCHHFNICHRDLKPENLLLDKKNLSVKIADFGMAALETTDKLLETSCGSPHYASPEIVMGQKYHGSPSDVWSCGIILFALLTGHLPFNDDNVKKLLLKVQSGKYQMPQNISNEAKDLIAKILIVDPAMRITIDEVLEHPLLLKYQKTRSKSSSNLHALDSTPNIVVLESEDKIDESILSNLQILWHGAPKEYLTGKLLQQGFTEEKLFYSLLLRYQERQKLPEASQPKPLSSLAPLRKTGSSNADTPQLGVLSAPRIVQKSQFSVNTLAKSPKKTREGYVASSSRVFKHSVSRRSLHVSPSSMKNSASSRSLKSSSSRMRLNSPCKQPSSPSKPATSPGKRRTLHNSASKRSLYSLSSISKRSLNLNEFLQDRPGSKTPPLPSTPFQFTDNEEQKTTTAAINEAKKIAKKTIYTSVLDDFQVSGSGNISSLPPVNKHPMSAAPIVQPAFMFGVGTGPVSNRASANSLSRPSLNSRPSYQSFRANSRSSARKEFSPRESSSVYDATNSNLRQGTDKSNMSTEEFLNTKPVMEKIQSRDLSLDRRLKISSPLASVAGKHGGVSLDPRRSAPDPPKTIENLLRRYSISNSLKSKSSLKKKRDSGAWSITGKSIFQDLGELPEENEHVKKVETRSSIDEYRQALTAVEVAKSTPVTDSSILAQSSSIHSNSRGSDGDHKAGAVERIQIDPVDSENTTLELNSRSPNGLLKMPSSFLHSSNTFANLNDFISNMNEDHDPNNNKASKMDVEVCNKPTSDSVMKHNLRTLTSGDHLNTSLTRRESKNSIQHDLRSNFSDLSCVVDLPIYTYTARAITISPANQNVLNISPVEQFYSEDMLDPKNSKEQLLSAVKLKPSFRIPHRQVTEEGTDKTIMTQEGESVNIFEDAPEDEGSLTTSSSGSVPNVHRKAVSIDTLNTTFVLAPTVDIRTSLYVNGSSTLPRETTEEIISKFKLSPERMQSNTKNAQRYSYQMTWSRSMVSMFKDLDNEIRIIEEPEGSETMNILSKGVRSLNVLEPPIEEQRIAVADIDDNQKEGQNIKRVTMLFDEYEPQNVFKRSPVKASKEDTVVSKPMKRQSPVPLPIDNGNTGFGNASGAVLTPIVESPIEPLTANTTARKHAQGSSSNKPTHASDGLKRSKGNWLTRLLHSFSKPRTLCQIHYTELTFDEVNLLILQKIGHSDIDFELKYIERRKGKQKIEYECWFTDGSFKHKINIFGENSTPTTVHIKHKSKNNNEETFSKLNEEIVTLIKKEEVKQAVK